MLIKQKGPSGVFYLRKKYDAASYSAQQRALDRFAGWRDQMTFDDLLRERGGPFQGELDRVGRIQRDGKTWERLRAPIGEYCFDVEIKPNGWMGDVVAVPPEEAWKLALEEDKRRDVPVVMEE